MKININDLSQIFISEFKKKVIFDLINRNEFFDFIHNGISQLIDQLYRSSFLNLKTTWIEKLKEENIEIPQDEEKLASLIFSRPDYLDRLEREIESQAIRTSHIEIQ